MAGEDKKASRHFYFKRQKSRRKAKSKFTSKLASCSFFFTPDALFAENPQERVIF